MNRPLSLKKRVAFALIPVLVVYLLIELATTTVAWFGWWDSTLWLFEDSGRTWQFDAIRGYRLTRTPSRFLRVTNGVLEYVGWARGNAQGFPDRDDFTPGRPDAEGGYRVRRFAVFGDSFTEAQYLGQNWPDRAEDLARERGERVQLLNFSVSGGGLANWWSILTKIVEADGYELDGVIFAVYPGDLNRTFSMWEHRGVAHPLFGRASGWDPRGYPATLAEARPILKEHPAFILPPEQFERVLQGSWPRGVPRRLRPFFLTQLWRHLRRAGPAADSEGPTAPPRDDAGRARLVADIRRTLQERGWPALVIQVPDRPGLLDPSERPAREIQDTRDFAEAIGARYLDAAPLFSSLGRAQIRAHYLPYDGHWNQAGSDRFASFVLDNLGPLHERQNIKQDQAGTTATGTR